MQSIEPISRSQAIEILNELFIAMAPDRRAELESQGLPEINDGYEGFLSGSVFVLEFPEYAAALALALLAEHALLWEGERAVFPRMLERVDWEAECATEPPEGALQDFFGVTYLLSMISVVHIFPPEVDSALEAMVERYSGPFGFECAIIAARYNSDRLAPLAERMRRDAPEDWTELVAAARRVIERNPIGS